MTDRLFYRVLIAFLLLALAGVLYLWWQQRIEVDRLEYQVQALRDRLELVEEAAQSPQPEGRSLLSDYERRRLQEQGLADPQRDLLADLAERPELIPQDGVLGGTMRFLPGESVVLNGHWAFAAYEDGHVRGTMLLEYEVEDGEVNWSVLEARLDE